MTIRAIAVLLAAALASRAACKVTEFERAAEGWLAAVNEPETWAFDQFIPGLADGGGCLTPEPPVVLSLDHGTLTLSAIDSEGMPACPVWDGSGDQTTDGYMRGPPNNVTLRLEFDPPIGAFYTYYGSLTAGRSVTMRLFGDESELAEFEGPVSTNDTDAVGHGFVSGLPIDRIEFTTGDDSGNMISLVGAFVGLLLGEPSLGQVTIPDYEGPGGSSTIELDFGVSFIVPTCLAADVDGDGFVGTGDVLLVLAQWGPCPPDCFADIDGDGTVGVLDFLTVLAEWGPCE